MDEKSDGKVKSPGRKHTTKTGEARGSDAQQEDPDSESDDDTSAASKKTGSKAVPTTTATTKAKAPAKAATSTKPSGKHIPKKPDLPQAPAMQMALQAGKKPQAVTKRKRFDTITAGSGSKTGKHLKVTLPSDAAVAASGDDPILVTAANLFRQMAGEIKTPATAGDQQDQPGEATPEVGKVNVAGMPYGEDKVIDMTTEMFVQAHAQDIAAKKIATGAAPTSGAEGEPGKEDQPVPAEEAPKEIVAHMEIAEGSTEVRSCDSSRPFVGQAAIGTPIDAP